MATDDRSFNERIRDRFFGRTHASDADADASTGIGDSESGPRADQPPGLSPAPRGSGVSEMGFFGRVPRPGGFDSPPEEPIEFDGPLPWELGGPAGEDGGDERTPDQKRDNR